MGGKGSGAERLWLIAAGSLIVALAAIGIYQRTTISRLSVEAGSWKGKAAEHEECCQRAENKSQAASHEGRVLAIKPRCDLGETGELLVVHTEIRSNKPFVGVFQGKHGLFRFTCFLRVQGRQCDGLGFLDLESIRKGDPLSYWDMSAAHGARIVSSSSRDSRYVVELPENGIRHTFTVDLIAKKVTYAAGEIRGEGSCE